MFCQEGYTDDKGSFLKVCKREVSTLLAHMTRETGLNDASNPAPKWRQGLHYITEINCTPPEHNDPPEDKCDYKSDETSASTTLWPPVDGVQYYGRGPFQLSWNYNYGPFS